jgi:hypothetical protein
METAACQVSSLASHKDDGCETVGHVPCPVPHTPAVWLLCVCESTTGRTGGVSPYETEWCQALGRHFKNQNYLEINIELSSLLGLTVHFSATIIGKSRSTSQTVNNKKYSVWHSKIRIAVFSSVEWSYELIRYIVIHLSSTAHYKLCSFSEQR